MSIPGRPALRLHIFHLLQTVSPQSIGRDVGVPARGLHGEAYRGHVFWDDRLALSAAELDRWDHVSRRLFVPFHDDGMISQFEGYEALDELDWEHYRAAYGDIGRLDRILEAESDTPNRYKASKQADLLMLFYLLSADELSALLCRLGYAWNPAALAQTFDYYEARTSGGSTPSALVSAAVAARARQDRGVELFFNALRTDVADVQGGTTAEGIHLAAMGGCIDGLQRCFAGVELRGDVLRLRPFWPGRLGAFQFSIFYRDHAITLRVEEHTARVSSRPGKAPPVRICCRGQMRDLRPGNTAVFSLPGRAG
jgi:trehalose/maltose hydrolase-like predicted phosphorylase